MSKTQDVFGASPKSVLNKPMMHVQESLPSGTQPPFFATGENVRQLNNVVTNEISGASLSSYLVTLPAGEYYIEAESSWGRTGTSVSNYPSHRAWIEDSSGNLVLGGVNIGSTAGYANGISPVSGKVTLTSPTTIKLIQQSRDTAVKGGSDPLSNGDNEIYSEMRIWKLDSNIETPVISDPTMTLARPLMQVQDQKPTGTAGGGSSVGWNERTLNTVLTNEIAGSSLSANVITLPAGEYYIEASAPATSSNGHRLALREDGGSIILNGESEYNGLVITDRAQLSGRFVLASSTDVILDHYIQIADGTDGLGIASSSGSAEIYADVRIWQLDAVVKKPVVGNVKLESYLAVDATGMTEVTLDCTAYDTFEFHSIDTAFTITLDQMDIGRTVVMNFSNAVAGPPSFVDTIKWTGAIAPEWTVADDTIVLTKFASGIVGAYNLEQI